MHNVELDTDPEAGKTEILATHLVEYLQSNPKATALIVTPMRLQQSIFMDALEGKAKISEIQRMDFAVPGHPLHRTYDAIYVDQIEFVGDQFLQDIQQWVCKENTFFITSRSNL